VFIQRHYMAHAIDNLQVSNATDIEYIHAGKAQRREHMLDEQDHLWVGHVDDPLHLCVQFSWMLCCASRGQSWLLSFAQSGTSDTVDAQVKWRHVHFAAASLAITEQLERFRLMNHKCSLWLGNSAAL
jgi:hypothetical protein